MQSYTRCIHGTGIDTNINSTRGRVGSMYECKNVCMHVGM